MKYNTKHFILQFTVVMLLAGCSSNSNQPADTSPEEPAKQEETVVEEKVISIDVESVVLHPYPISGGEKEASVIIKARNISENPIEIVLVNYRILDEKGDVLFTGSSNVPGTDPGQAASSGESYYEKFDYDAATKVQIVSYQICEGSLETGWSCGAYDTVDFDEPITFDVTIQE